MYNKDFLEKLFNLYQENTFTLHGGASNEKNPSCYEKYLHSLPRDYVYDFPNSVALKLTEACNLRCKHCFFAERPEYYNKPSEFNTEELIALINFLVDDINILSIMLTGGEVFFRKDFFEILKHIKIKSLPVTIQTNGTLINAEKALLLESILNKKTDIVQISLDGADKESHEKIRGEGTFDKTINAIKLLSDSGINIQVNSTLTTISAPGFTNIFELCQNLNVNNISVSKYEVCNEKQQYLKLTDSELIKYSSDILIYAKKFKNIKFNYKPLDIFEFLKYPAGRELLEDYIKTNSLQIPQHKCLTCNNHSKLTISSEGNVFFCSRDESQKAVLGNLRENSFYDIWENRFNIPYFQKRDLTTTKCKNCKFIPICNTGCIANAYKKYGDINFASSECCYFEEYIKEQNG